MPNSRPCHPDRSGGTCSSAPCHRHPTAADEPASPRPKPCHPDRSGGTRFPHPPQLCHPNRSGGTRFPHPPQLCHPDRSGGTRFPHPQHCHPDRSGGTCCSFPRPPRPAPLLSSRRDLLPPGTSSHPRPSFTCPSGAQPRNPHILPSAAERSDVHHRSPTNIPTPTRNSA